MVIGNPPGRRWLPSPGPGSPRVLLPEEQPHLRQVPQSLAGEQPSAVRHPMKREPGLLAFADLAIRTDLVVRDHRRRHVCRSKNKLKFIRQPTPGPKSARDLREIEADDGFLDLARVVFGPVHGDQECPHGRPGRAVPGIDRCDRRPGARAFSCLGRRRHFLAREDREEPQDPAPTRQMTAMIGWKTPLDRIWRIPLLAKARFGARQTLAPTIAKRASDRGARHLRRTGVNVRISIPGHPVGRREHGRSCGCRPARPPGRPGRRAVYPDRRG